MMGMTIKHSGHSFVVGIAGAVSGFFTSRFIA
jgi:hypothetical protein